MSEALRAELSRLAVDIGAPAEELVIAGEGNVSGVTGDGTLLVSASGTRLGAARTDDWVEVRPQPLLAALERSIPDAEWLEAILASRVRPDDPRPTVEVALHAVLAELTGARFIAHTHPTAVLSLLCSDLGPVFARTRLIPDHVVMLGTADCFVPYVDPGQELARAIAAALREHEREFGELPCVVLAANHGMFVLGSTARETLDRTRMVVKAARAYLGTRAAGRDVVGLTPQQVARIAGREDEQYRRRILA